MKPTVRPDPEEQISHAVVASWPLASGSLGGRLTAAVGRRWLDRRLAHGADPASSSALALRARQLTSRRTREKLARSIDRVLRAADHPRRWGAIARPDQDAVRSVRGHLHLISEILHGQELVYARGVALSYALLRDGESPLFCPSEAGSAWYWAQLATHALEGHI